MISSTSLDMLCVGFNPTRTKGVFVGYDEEGSGNSHRGLPGREPTEFNKGDWMIRASLERATSHDALKDQAATANTESSFRTWKDASGKFTLEAVLVDVKNGNVRLKKENGEIISVAFDKLSTQDQDFLKKK